MSHDVALEAALAAFRAARPWCEVDEASREDDMAVVVVFRGTRGDHREPRVELWHVFAAGTAQLVHSSP